MLDPSAPPYNMNIPVAYPSNQQKNNYNRLNDTQIDDETIAINLHHQLNQTQNNDNIYTKTSQNDFMEMLLCNILYKFTSPNVRLFGSGCRIILSPEKIF